MIKITGENNPKLYQLLIMGSNYSYTYYVAILLLPMWNNLAKLPGYSQSFLIYLNL